MNICCTYEPYCIFMKIPPSLLHFVYMAAPITMATPVHHRLKLNEATPRTGRLLFCVITPVRHTPICVPTADKEREEGGGGIFYTISRQRTPTASNYLTFQTIPQIAHNSDLTLRPPPIFRYIYVPMYYTC